MRPTPGMMLALYFLLTVPCTTLVWCQQQQLHIEGPSTWLWNSAWHISGREALLQVKQTLRTLQVKQTLRRAWAGTTSEGYLQCLHSLLTVFSSNTLLAKDELKDSLSLWKGRSFIWSWMSLGLDFSPFFPHLNSGVIPVLFLATVGACWHRWVTSCVKISGLEQTGRSEWCISSLVKTSDGFSWAERRVLHIGLDHICNLTIGPSSPMLATSRSWVEVFSSNLLPETCYLILGLSECKVCALALRDVT